MHKISPFLMFNGNIEGAMNLYTSVFKNAKAERVVRAGNGAASPKDSVTSATFQLAGLEIPTYNGGPHFKFSPAISFFTSCETSGEVDALWSALTPGGKVFMDLAKYPFSERYGWVQDKYGISWQLSLAGRPQKITPFLTFTQDQDGRAEEAVNFYTSIFRGSDIRNIVRFEQGEGGTVGAVKHASFTLEGQEFMAMDGGKGHAWTFTEGISLFVNCGTQEEVDDFWERLSAGGRKSQCGWVSDKFGLSWQIVPSILMRYLGDKDRRKSASVMEAMLKMGKLEISKLQEAYERV